MAVPQVTGSYSAHLNEVSTQFDISGIAPGSWMIVSIMRGSTGKTITEPAGWTVINAGETSGTRSNYLFAKIKTVNDSSTAVFSLSSPVTVCGVAMLWGTGAGPISNWVIGSSWHRSSSAQPSGARYDNIAPGITTSGNDQLALVVSHEATNAYTQSMEVTNVAPSGWTQRLYLSQVATNDRIETIWMGTKPIATPSATGDTTVTYISPVDNNGWAMQISLAGEEEPVIVTPTVVGTPTTFISAATTTSFTIARPSGVTTGDYIVVAVRGQNSSTTVGPASTGFSRLGPAFEASNSLSRTMGLYGRPVPDASAEPSSYTFTLTATGSARLVATAFIVRGVDLTDPIVGFHNSYSGTGVTGGRRVESYPLTQVPSLGLFLGASEFTANNLHTPTITPSGYTKIIDVTSDSNTAASRTYLWVGQNAFSISPTATAEIGWTLPSSTGAEGVALRGLDSNEVPDPAGLGTQAYDGAGNQTKVYYTTADGPKTPASLIPMRRGFSSVAEMLATPGFTWAHRGGSASYAEHSLYGYTQSVARGYGVLEVSLARTSDGVWFALHDQTTDRTSGGTYGNASSQTWAQIQAQQIVVGGQGAPQPYMSWKQLIAAYGRSHIIVADPKYALGGYRTEFLTMVNKDLGPTRAIIKYSGGGSGAALLSTDAQALGFQTWGFFYAADASVVQGGSGALQTWGPSWTILGMEYSASQAVWNEVIALNKPIVGHIAPNQAAYNTAIAKGAIGVQVGGVAVVDPVSWWTQ